MTEPRAFVFDWLPPVVCFALGAVLFGCDAPEPAGRAARHGARGWCRSRPATITAQCGVTSPVPAVRAENTSTAAVPIETAIDVEFCFTAATICSTEHLLASSDVLLPCSVSVTNRFLRGPVIG